MHPRARQPLHLWFPFKGFLQQGLLCFFVLALAGCVPEPPEPSAGSSSYRIELPPGIPDMPMPEDFRMTSQTVGLGRQLFFDPVLSRDSSISCGSCHHQEIAFADFTRFSEGAQGRMGFRNAPGLFNLAWHDFYNKDGGTATIELQMLVPITDHAEMDFSLREAAERLNRHPKYPQAFDAAFGSQEVTPFTLTRALSAFERSLISFNAPFDRYRYYGETDALTASQVRGKDLFYSSRLKCGNCHSNFDLRQDSFENNGLYAFYADSGRARVTWQAEDHGKFKVPSLRNVALTPPYMHDGSLASLSDVIDHYASGGAQHPNQSPFVSGFSISPQEKADLLNFMEALTDESFLSNPEYQP